VRVLQNVCGMHQKKEIDAGLSQVSQFPLEILCTSGQKCFSLAARALNPYVPY